MANHLMESSDSCFATTSNNNFPLAGTEFKTEKQKPEQNQAPALINGSFNDMEQSLTS